MNILITGATGFLGGAMLEQIRSKGIKDNIYLLTSKPVKDFEYILHNNYTYSKNQLPDRIDCVVCMGAFVPKNGQQQTDGFLHASAVLNLKYLLDNLPNVPEKVIFLSSVEVYGRNGSGIAVTEECEVMPYNLYSAQKVMCEGIVRNFSETTGALCSILRLGPIFGPNDTRTEAFLPGSSYKAIAGETVRLTVPPGTKRNYIYVKDCVRAVLASVYSDKTAPIINIVSKNNYEMAEIAKTVIDVVGRGSLVISENVTGNVPQMVYDGRLMEKILCKEEYSLKDAVYETYMSINKTRFGERS